MVLTRELVTKTTTHEFGLALVHTTLQMTVRKTHAVPENHGPQLIESGSCDLRPAFRNNGLAVFAVFSIAMALPDLA
jgi:hypothetical protein